jgi:hypothetical protein
MTLKSQLIDFLSDLPNAQNSQERPALIDYFGLQHLRRKINQDGNPLTFCAGLISVLALEGRDVLLDFLDRLANSDGIGLDRKQELTRLRADIATIDSDEWQKEFVGSAEVHTLESCVSTLEQRLSQTSEKLLHLGSQVQQHLAREQGINREINLTKTREDKLSLDPYPLVPHLSPREETVDTLKEIFLNHTWTAIHGSLGSGKTQLASLLVQKLSTQKLSTCGAWVRLRDLTVERACERLDNACEKLVGFPPQGSCYDWYCQICQQLGNATMIVLDDLPRFAREDELSERLIQLGRACNLYGVRLISTSPYPLPPSFRTLLDDQLLYTIASPPFTNLEATEIFHAYDAPASFLTPDRVGYMNRLAKQDPSLLVAMAQYLRQQDWQVTPQTLEELFKGEHTAELNDETINRILKTIQDSQSQELLYRLSLIIGDFSLEDMQAVASIEPSVKRPRQCLNALIGLWVQRDVNNRLLVSPLIKALGSSDLEIETFKKCHLTLGERLINQGEFNQYDAINALVHFCSAEAFNKAGTILILAFYELEKTDGLVDDGGLSSWCCNQPLPEQMDLGIRLSVRGLQVVVRHKYGKDTSYLVEDLNVLFGQASEREAWAIPGVVANLSRYPDLVVSTRANRYFLTALRCLPQAKMPDGRELVLPSEVSFEWLLWANTSEIATAEHLRDWMNTVEQLTPEQRQRAFSAKLAHMGCLRVSDRLWLREADKPEYEQDWHVVLVAIRELAERANRLNLDLLWGCAIRAQIITLAGYHHDLNGALIVAEEALAQASDDPRIQFLIKECLGRQYVYANRNDEALIWLDQALSQHIQAYSLTRMHTLLSASRAAGSQEPYLAIQYAQQAVRLAETSEEIPKTELVKALGELAIAKWLAIDLAAAFEPWERAGEQLLSCKPDISMSDMGSSGNSGAVMEDIQQAMYFASISEAISESNLQTFSDLAIPQSLFSDSSTTLASRNLDQERLLEQGADINAWKSLFAVYGHLSGYFTYFASSGSPPPDIQDGEPYAAPTAGIFLTHNPKRVAYYNSSRDSLLPAQLAKFAEAIGNDERAAVWALKGIDMAREANQHLALPSFSQNVIPHLLVINHYAEVLDLAVEAGEILVAVFQHGQAGGNFLDSNLDVESVLGSKPNELWYQAERNALIMGLLPSTFRLSTIAIRHPDLARTQAADIAKKCREISERSAAQALWTIAADLIEQIYLQETSCRELIRRCQYSNLQDNLLQTIGYLAATLQEGATLAQALAVHFAIIPFVYDLFKPKSTIYRRIVLPFIATYWKTSLEQVQFRFSSPLLIYDLLRQAENLPEAQQAQLILATVAKGLGISPPPEFLQWVVTSVPELMNLLSPPDATDL